MAEAGRARGRLSNGALTLTASRRHGEENQRTMRARTGDPPRTMAQKILAARAGECAPGGAADPELVCVGVDQIVLARAPMRVFGQALAFGLKKTGAELAVAYESRCITGVGPEHEASASIEMLGHGVLVARAGVGFPAAVHLERFASPARLCLTDEPR